MGEELEIKIWKEALRNAILHGGEAKVNSVLGSVVSGFKDVDPKETVEKVKKVIDEVNELPMEVQKEEAAKLEVSLDTEKEEREGLPPIPNEEEGAVITRAAPKSKRSFPSGQLQGIHTIVPIRGEERREIYTEVRRH